MIKYFLHILPLNVAMSQVSWLLFQRITVEEAVAADSDIFISFTDGPVAAEVRQVTTTACCSP